MIQRINRLLKLPFRLVIGGRTRWIMHALVAWMMFSFGLLAGGQAAFEAESPADASIDVDNRAANLTANVTEDLGERDEPKGPVASRVAGFNDRYQSLIPDLGPDLGLDKYIRGAVYAYVEVLMAVASWIAFSTADVTASFVYSNRWWIKEWWFQPWAEAVGTVPTFVGMAYMLRHQWRQLPEP